MPLLERRHSLDALTEYAADARDRAGRLVLVSGEAGVGKSSLVDRFLTDTPDARRAVGACDGLFIPRPLGPLFDIAEQLGGELLEAAGTGATRDELFGVLLRQLDRSASLTVLVIEDVHWADESTLDLLRHLGRRIRDLPVLVIATYRNDVLATTHPLRVVLGELASQRSTRRVDVGPLSADAVATLANIAASRLTAADLYRLTGGNPFFVTEVLRSDDGELPLSARDAVAARVAHLSADARRTVETAALDGVRVDAALLAVVPGASLDVLDELVAAGVFASDGAALRFRHEIIRLAVEQQVTAHRRGPIHRDVLAELRRQGCDDDARLAYHAEGAGDRDAVLAFAPRAAARAAALAAHRESAEQYERAVRFSPEPSDAGVDDGTLAVLADLNDRLARETSLVDRWQDAADARSRAIGLWRRLGDARREGDAHRYLSRAMWRLCRGDEALAEAEAAAAILEPLGPTPELGWAWANLANERTLEGDASGALVVVRRARELAGELGLEPLESDALNTEACLLHLAGDDGTPLLRRALRLALDAGADEQAGRAYANLYEFLVTEFRLVEANECFVEGVAFCEDHELATFVSCLHGRHAVAVEVAGRWDEALRPAARLLDVEDLSPVNRLTPQLTSGRIHARRGDISPWPWLDEATAHAQSTNEPLWIAVARTARAEAHWLEGRSAEAVGEIVRAAAEAGRCDEWTRGAVAGWGARLGLDLDLPGGIAAPYRLARDGRFAEAAAWWRRLGCPYQEALALLDSGEDEPMREAVRRFEALGAGAAVTATRRAMRERGMRSIPVGFALGDARSSARPDRA